MQRAGVVIAIVALPAPGYGLELGHAIDACLDAGGCRGGGACAFLEPDGRPSTAPQSR
ncbi:MAG TPA: hypothetical protein VNV16_13055 [Methylibium sp.]|nr:hypothetical protein [Methylibium sp.]